MIRLLTTQDFHALKYEGRTFDCGSKLGFLLANVAYRWSVLSFETS